MDIGYWILDILPVLDEDRKADTAWGSCRRYRLNCTNARRGCWRFTRLQAENLLYRLTTGRPCDGAQRLSHGNRTVYGQVESLAAKHRIGPNPQRHDQIAWRPTHAAGQPLPPQSDRSAGGGPRFEGPVYATNRELVRLACWVLWPRGRYFAATLRVRRPAAKSDRSSRTAAPRASTSATAWPRSSIGAG